MKNQIITLIFLFLFTSIKAQKWDEALMKMNRKYNRELCVDVQSFFNTRYNGSYSIIYKTRYKGDKLISLNSVKNNRYMFNLDINWGNLDKTKLIDFEKYYPVIYYSNVNQIAQSNHTRRNLGVFFSYGREKVLFLNRFNFYFGLDASIGYNYYNSGVSVQLNGDMNGVGDFYTKIYPYHKVTSHYFYTGISPFIGAKYRISENFSFSLESSFSLGYRMNFSKNELWKLNSIAHRLELTPTEKHVKGNFYWNMDYARLLSVNFHF